MGGSRSVVQLHEVAEPADVAMMSAMIAKCSCASHPSGNRVAVGARSRVVNGEVGDTTVARRPWFRVGRGGVNEVGMVTVSLRHGRPLAPQTKISAQSWPTLSARINWSNLIHESVSTGQSRLFVASVTECYETMTV